MTDIHKYLFRGKKLNHRMVVDPSVEKYFVEGTYDDKDIEKM